MYLPNILLDASTTAVTNVADSMNNGMTIQEKVTMSLEMLADGLGTVFLVLILLWGLLSLFRLVFYDIPNKRKKDAHAPSEPQDTPDDTPVAEASSESYDEVAYEAQYEDETQLVAVITAAVAAYMDTENEANGIVADDINTSFRVVSFKRKSGGEWNKNSR